jgi:hypothetical protein
MVRVRCPGIAGRSAHIKPRRGSYRQATIWPVLVAQDLSGWIALPRRRGGCGGRMCCKPYDRSDSRTSSAAGRRAGSGRRAGQGRPLGRPWDPGAGRRDVRVSDRVLRRWRARSEADGFEGLADRRLVEAQAGAARPEARGADPRSRALRRVHVKHFQDGRASTTGSSLATPGANSGCRDAGQVSSTARRVASAMALMRTANQRLEPARRRQSRCAPGCASPAAPVAGLGGDRHSRVGAP